MVVLTLYIGARVGFGDVVRGQVFVAVKSASGGVLCDVAEGSPEGRVGLPKLVESSSNCRWDSMAPCN